MLGRPSDADATADRTDAWPVGAAVLVALAVSVLLVPARPIVLVALALGVVAAPRLSAPHWACAAGLPVALILVWGGVAPDLLESAELRCGDPASPVALLRVAEAVAVAVVVVLLSGSLGEPFRSLGFRRPARPEVALGLGAVALIPIAGLILGERLAEPFFGPIRLDLAQPGALLPAVALAVANGSMEELAYRGALLSWSARILGPTAALIGQAVVFGAAHTGSDYVASALPVVLAVMAGGLVAGLIVRRTGSLFVPIVVHACFDVPLYYAAACRLP